MSLADDLTLWRSDASHFAGLPPMAGTGIVASPRRILTDDQLVGMYLHSRFSRVIVDRPPMDCTRQGWIVRAKDDEDAFKDAQKRLQVKTKFRRADQWRRLYGGAGIVMILDDDGRIDEPITGRVKGVKALHVFTSRELIPAAWFTKIEDPRFGEPSHYFIHPRRAHTTAVGGWSSEMSTLTSGWDAVHADRVIPFHGLPIPEEYAAADYYHWGQSQLEAAYQALVDINTAADGVKEATDKFQYGVLKLHKLAEILTGADADRGENSRFRRRLDGIEEGKRSTRSIVIDAEDEYTTQTTQLSGLVEAYQIMQQNLSAETRIPVTLFFGQSPSGLSTDDQSGTRNYYDGIRTQQADIYAPALERLFTLLAEAGEGPAEFEIEFPDLMAPTDQEEATTNKTVAETDAINILNGVYTAEEARQRYTGTTIITGAITVPDTTPDDDEDYAAMQAALEEVGGEGAIREPEAADEREFDSAQVTAMTQIVQAVAEDTLPERGAVEILKLGFGLTDDEARRFFADKKIRQPAAPDAPAGPAAESGGDTVPEGASPESAPGSADGA